MIINNGIRYPTNRWNTSRMLCIIPWNLCLKWCPYTDKHVKSCSANYAWYFCIFCPVTMMMTPPLQSQPHISSGFSGFSAAFWCLGGSKSKTESKSASSGAQAHFFYEYCFIRKKLSANGATQPVSPANVSRQV